MADALPFEIFLTAPPGLEPLLRDEAAALGLPAPRVTPGGVTLEGGWPEVMRANLHLRGATRVLARIAAFRALHLAQLDKRARRLPWSDTLRPDVPIRIDVTTRKSRIYHAGAARARIADALRETLGAPIAEPLPGAETDPATGPATDVVILKVRIDDDLCTVSVDTSGALLHRRGHKQAVNAAPLRETLAALFLRAAGYTGAEPVLDPMCGSGTFPIEAAEIATGLAPGRSRAFAFERLATFDPAAWAALKAADQPRPTPFRFHGRDRDAGAVAMSRANAARAGVAAVTDFAPGAVSDLMPPEGPPGLVIVNPPYGVRLGEPARLRPLYAALGATLRDRFEGWRVALVTTDPALAAATALPFAPPGPPVPHGPLKSASGRPPPCRRRDTAPPPRYPPTREPADPPRPPRDLPGRPRRPAAHGRRDRQRPPPPPPPPGLPPRQRQLRHGRPARRPVPPRHLRPRRLAPHHRARAPPRPRHPRPRPRRLAPRAHGRLPRHRLLRPRPRLGLRESSPPRPAASTSPKSATSTAGTPSPTSGSSTPTPAPWKPSPSATKRGPSPPRSRTARTCVPPRSRR